MALLEAFAGVITRNVDGLHHTAGAREVVVLHGSFHRVRCLDCGEMVAGRSFPDLLLSLNGTWLKRVRTAVQARSERARRQG